MSSLTLSFLSFALHIYMDLQYRMYPIPLLNLHPFYCSLKDMIFYVIKTIMIGNLLVMIESALSVIRYSI